MLGGDIDNTVVPRLVLVWEHLLGLLPDQRAEAKVRNRLRFKRWQSACDVFVINEPLAHRIWDVTWRMNYSVDLITFIGPEFAEVVAKRIESEDLPIGHVKYENETQLARKLAHMPYVAAIYTPNPQHQFTFGAKGRVVSPSDPHSLDQIGRF